MSPRKIAFVALCGLLATLVDKKTYEGFHKKLEEIASGQVIPTYGNARVIGEQLEAPVTSACKLLPPELAQESKKLRPKN